MKESEGFRLNLIEPDAGVIAAFICAIIGDIGLTISILTLILIPFGLILHYMVAIIIVAVIWPKLKSPKGENTGNQGLNKEVDAVINKVISPKIVLILAVILPLPFLIIGMILAMILQNAMVKMLIDVGVKLAVVGVATGGVGDIAEGAAAVAEVSEAAAGAAETASVTAETAGAVSEAGEAAQATKGATEAGSRSFGTRYKEEVGKELKGRAMGGEGGSGEEGGEEGSEDDGSEEGRQAEEERLAKLSPEERELEEILSGDYVGRSIRENLSAEAITSQIGAANLGEKSSKFNPDETIQARPNPTPAPRQATNDRYNDREVDLRDAA